MPAEIPGEGGGHGQPFGMGPVGAEEESVDTQHVLQYGHVVLVERCHPDVAAEGVHRIGGEGRGHLAVGLGQLLDQGRDPLGPGFDAGHPEVGEPVEEALAHQGGHGLEGWPVRADD